MEFERFPCSLRARAVSAKGRRKRVKARLAKELVVRVQNEIGMLA